MSSFLEAIEQWVAHLWAHFQTHGAIPDPPSQNNQVPVTLHPLPPPTSAIGTPPVIVTPRPTSVPAPSPAPAPEPTVVVGYGPVDKDGYCTVLAVEQMRRDISDRDPTYHLPSMYLCPEVVEAMAPGKDKIVRQWLLSQVPFWNSRAFGGQGNVYDNGFFPGVEVEVTINPGMENEPDTIPTKWHLVRGDFLETPKDGWASNYRMADPKLNTAAEIAKAVHDTWVAEARGRGINVG